MLSYDETRLVRRLNAIYPSSKIAFAAACAERLFPFIENYSHAIGSPVTVSLRRLLDKCWHYCAVPPDNQNLLQSEYEECYSLIPNEDLASKSGVPYIEDAVSSIAYALRTVLSDEGQEAAYAARCACELLEHYLSRTLSIDLREPVSAEKIYQHPLMQQELLRQENLLSELEQLREIGPTSFQQIQQRAQVAANKLLEACIVA